MPRAPRVLHTAGGDSEQERGRAGCKDQRATPIELGQLLLHVAGDGRLVQEQDDKDARAGNDWQVDPEDPPPVDVLRKASTQQRADNCAYGPDSTEDGEPKRGEKRPPPVSQCLPKKENR